MDDGAVEDRGRRQNDLHEDVVAIREYAKRFPDTWTGLKYDGDRLVVLFTDPDAHRHQIGALVAHPDRVDVHAAKRSDREVQAIVAKVADRLQSSAGRWFSYGPHLDVVSVELHGNAEDIARELHDRFGDAVDLTVGAHSFPFPDPPPPAPLIPAPQSTVRIDAAGLRAIPDSAVITMGETFAGQVEITNIGNDEQLVIDTDQPLLGQLLRGDHLVSVFPGPVAGTGQHVRLDPGGRVTLPFFAGTDSLDLRTGAMLPPGGYQLVVVIPVHSFAGAQVREQLVTPPVPIDIVAAPELRGEPDQA
jgi:hypothetical protein